MLVSLQTELRDRQWDKAVLVGVQAMPLGQDSERRHRKGQVHLEIGPHTLQDLFAMHHQHEHRPDRLNHHAGVPLPPQAELEIG